MGLILGSGRCSAVGKLRGDECLKKKSYNSFIYECKLSTCSIFSQQIFRLTNSPRRSGEGSLSVAWRRTSRLQNIDTMDIVFTVRVFARNQVEVAHRYTTGLKSTYVYIRYELRQCKEQKAEISLTKSVEVEGVGECAEVDHTTTSCFARSDH